MYEPGAYEGTRSTVWSAAASRRNSALLRGMADGGYLLMCLQVFSLSLNKHVFFNAPLGIIVALTVSSKLNTGTISAISGMRVAAGERQPAAANPRLYLVFY